MRRAPRSSQSEFFFPAGRSEKRRQWCCDFSSTCARALGRRWGSCCRSRAAQGRVRFAWRRAALSGSPQIKLLHIGGTIPAAVMNYRLNTSPLPQRPRLVFIRLCCFLSDINLVDTVCFKKVSVREQPLKLRENGLVELLRLQSSRAGWLCFTLSLKAS